jgi:hypothetical protein
LPHAENRKQRWRIQWMARVIDHLKIGDSLVRY